MASPPFGLSTSSPADTDIVSQFPANERTNRDEIQSWIVVDHDTNGNHPVIHLPYQSSAPATPASSVGAMYVDVNGNLIIKKSDGNLYYVGVPPGTISYTSGSTPDNGYVLANGQAISRTGIGAALFARIGTTYGAGDGSTTFNVPDATGRVLAGKEAADTRLTTGGSGISGSTLGATGGSETVTMLRSDMPNITLAFHGNSPGQSFYTSLNTSYLLDGANSAYYGVTSGNLTGAATPSGNIDPLNGGVSQTNMKNVQPTIVQLIQIKL